MPSLGQKRFKPSPCPHDLKPNDKVFYLPLTNEVFTSYENFFLRQISLSSMIWTCSVTGKTGLTFEEALESEKSAKDTLKTYPSSFAKPLLYLVHKLSCRGRMEDLVNDIYYFVKDHYLIGEEVTLGCGRSRKDVKIWKVTYAEVLNDTLKKPNNNSEKTDTSVKKGELLIPSAEHYTYDVMVLNPENKSIIYELRNQIKHYNLTRSKSLWARNILRLILKSSCVTNHERLVVKEELVQRFDLENMTWEEVFNGPVAQFPQTPLVSRGTVRRVHHSRSYINGTCASDVNIPSTSDVDCVHGIQRDQVLEETKFVNKDKKDNTGERTTKKKQKHGKASKKKVILEQQEELEGLFEQARKMNIENLSRWEQNDHLLSEAEIVALKQLIRQTKEKERKEIRLRKQRMKEILSEWKKPRDDVLCDDLRPLPDLEPFLLPAWMSDDDFGQYLCIFEFFQSFSELLPVKEVRGTHQIKFCEIVSAIRSCNPEQDSMFVQLIHILLKAKTERADEEDGDEVNLNRRDEISPDANDIDHKLYGSKIREATILHENVRLTHGLSARHLPIDWMTITEVLRLSIITSGYYTGAPTHRFRLFSRGAIRCYEDEGFLFANENPRIMSILEKKSVFDLQPHERLALLKMLMHQLLSYHKFRSLCDERISSLLDARKELKNLRSFDLVQEKEAREASLVREYELEQIEELGEAARIDFAKKEELSKETVILLNFVKSGSFIGRRDDKLKHVERILMKGVSYVQMEIDDIKKVRSLQMEHITAAEDDLLGRVGWLCLGRDRAFRTFWYLDSFPLLLVEDANSSDERGSCIGPTPLDKAKKFRQSYSSDDDVRKALLGCTSTDECPVHGKVGHRRWQLITCIDVLEKIESSCNSRGLRESELLENLKFFSPLLKNILTRCSEKIISGEIYKDLFLSGVDFADNLVSFDWNREFVDMLLDLEEKIEQGCIGHLAIGETYSRKDWRQSLLEKHSVASFVDKNFEIFGEVVLSVTQVQSLNELEHLALAFLQIVQGINIKFLRLPFATASSKERNCVNIPTTTFDQWQKSLLKCSSTSALSLHYATLESAIMWTRSRLQARCRKCRKKGETEKLCMCTRCDRCYHIDCAKPKIEDPCGWMCSDCEDFDEQSSSQASDHACGTSTDECIEQSFVEFELPMDVFKTSSGRVVKKVEYADNSSVGKRELRKRKAGTYAESDSDDDDSSEKKSECTSVTMSLRDSNSRTRDSLRDCELLISEAMRQQSSWPFLRPVEARIVPDYYQIIKRPMDLRTMMNKLKQKLYDTPDQVVADARLIIANCRIYNEEDSEIYEVYCIPFLCLYFYIIRRLTMRFFL
ncbi:unnamed protein product [Thelazia callipaeda]|uniref:Bromodomain adjacent to zinc finger domain protein 1A n=1 Tax=Thelazia callipaeda TaxID=103827 RepID=A0A158RCM5_THECL|nr:unnamed protein product [Thelazia callipaeda]